MTNYIERARMLARAVADGATDLTIAIFRVYIAAAGASVKGAWVYIPGRATPLKGWRAAGGYVATLADTAAFLRNLANAIDLAEREVNGPPSLGQTPVYAADLNPVMPTVDDLAQVAQHISDLAAQLAATPQIHAPDPFAIVIGDEAELLTLTDAQERLAQRIARRAAYDTLRTMLRTLDGWVEGVIEDSEARELHDRPRDEHGVTFHVADIRNMVNDAARLMGVTVMPWRAEQ